MCVNVHVHVCLVCCIAIMSCVPLSSSMTVNTPQVGDWARAFEWCELLQKDRMSDLHHQYAAHLEASGGLVVVVVVVVC